MQPRENTTKQCGIRVEQDAMRRRRKMTTQCRNIGVGPQREPRQQDGGWVQDRVAPRAPRTPGNFHFLGIWRFRTKQNVENTENPFFFFRFRCFSSKSGAPLGRSRLFVSAIWRPGASAEISATPESHKEQRLNQEATRRVRRKGRNQSRSKN